MPKQIPTQEILWASHELEQDVCGREDDYAHAHYAVTNTPCLTDTDLLQVTK
jgi:hypothetical protein